MSRDSSGSPMRPTRPAIPSLLVAGTVTLVCATTSTIAMAQATASAWPQFRHDTQHTGVNPLETTLSVETVPRLEEIWSVQTDGLVTASPAVLHGVVYVPSGDGRVYALNAETGALLWRSANIEAGYPSPAVVGGRVYVGTGVDFCRLYALDAGTGAVLWRTPVIGGGMTSPAVAGGRVFVGSGESLYALDAATGSLLWAAPTDTLFSSPAVVHGRVFVGGGPNTYALDAATGKIIWKTLTGSFGSGIWTSPAVVDGRVFVGSNDAFTPNTYALDAETGAILWVEYNPIEVVLSSPAVANGVVFIASNDSAFTAHDADDGSILWRASISAANSSPAVANGVVYASGTLGLSVLDAETGSLLKNINIGFAHYSSPTVVNGMVYVGSFNGKLYALGLPH